MPGDARIDAVLAALRAEESQSQGLAKMLVIDDSAHDTIPWCVIQRTVNIKL